MKRCSLALVQGATADSSGGSGLWTAINLGRQGCSCRAQSVPGAVEDLRAHCPQTITAIEIFSPLPNRWVDRRRELAWAQLIAIRQVRAVARPPHRIGRGCAGCHRPATRWLSFAITRVRRSSRCFRRHGTRHRSGGCRPGSAPAQFRRETRRHRRLAACRPRAAFRWRGRGTALLGAGYTPRSEAPALLQGGGILQER